MSQKAILVAVILVLLVCGVLFLLVNPEWLAPETGPGPTHTQTENPQPLSGPEPLKKQAPPTRQPIPGQKNPLPPKPDDPHLLEGRVVDNQLNGLAKVPTLLMTIVATPASLLERFPAGKKNLGTLSARFMAEQLKKMGEQFQKTGQLPTDKEMKLKSMFFAGLKKISKCQTDQDGWYCFPETKVPDPKKQNLIVVPLSPAGFLLPDPIQVCQKHLGPKRGPHFTLHSYCFVSGLLPEGHISRGRIYAIPIDKKASLVKQKQLYYRTEKDNSFIIPELPPGTWRLLVIRPFYHFSMGWGPVLQLERGKPTTGIHLVFTGGCGLKMTTWGPGKQGLTVPAQVTVSLISAGPPGDVGADLEITTPIFAPVIKPATPKIIEGFCPGRYRLKAQIVNLSRKMDKTGKYTVEKEILLTPGMREVDLEFPTLPDLGFLQLLVKDQYGEPVIKAKANMGAIRKYAANVVSLSAQTDHHGRLLFDGIPRVKINLVITKEGYKRTDLKVDMEKVPSGLYQKEVVLKRITLIKGQVYLANGQPAKKIKITAFHRLPPKIAQKKNSDGTTSFINGGIHSTQTNFHGIFKIKDVKPGNYEIWVKPRNGEKMKKMVAVKKEIINSFTFQLP